MTSARSRAWAAARVLPLLLLMGNKPSCDNQPLTLSCDDVSVQLDLGACVDLQNPCADHTWVRLDAFRLCDDLDGLFVQRQHEPRARQLCADASVGTLIDEPFQFYYARPGDAGVGTLRVTIGSAPLTVTASATPSSIPSGGASQLETMVSGGSPPYAFSWSPSTGLSATDIPNPIATPTVSTEYAVVVSDSNGLLASDHVTVSVAPAGLTACITLVPISPIAVQADGTCSTGGIVLYRWWSDYRGQPPTAETTTPLSPVFTYEIGGDHVVRLEVVDAAGATAATTAIFTSP